MNKEIVKKLKSWRLDIGRKENIELYRVLHNKTIEDVATLLPKNKEEFLSINGIGEKKFQKYGNEMLSIIRKCEEDNYESQHGDIIKPAEISEQREKVYSVSNFLDFLNNNLLQIRVGIRGEVTSVDDRDNYLFFSLKDKKDEATISCFMWRNDYETCGVKLEEGLELTVYGTPEIYKRSGRFSFRVSIIELVGEGALKKAYEELKKKLKTEGLFEEARKKPIPDYPQRIGLITSRDGAVINDFLNNIGRFGYKITFVDSRVEGVMAVKDLINAVKSFQDKPVDVLVIIRGGGSLESLQAFNNEALIREVVKMPMPVLCGIGHDKDVPLLSFVADKAVSTPSIVAKEINKSWERAVDKLEYYEKTIISKYEGVLRDSQYKLENASIQMKEFYQNIFRKFEQYQQALKNFIANMSHTIKHEKYKIQKLGELLVAKFKDSINEVKNGLNIVERELYQNNPERQLKLGYSIVTLNGKVIKSASQVKEGDILISKFGEGKVQSEAQEIFNN